MINGQQMASDVKFYLDYSKYNYTLRRKESWEEAVDRVDQMHRERLWSKISKDEVAVKMYEKAINLYKKKSLLGSQRALQFGGEPILKHHSKMYNCLTSYADRVEFFQEAMYWLLSGCGVGFSVLPEYVSKLPKIHKRTKSIKTFTPEDSIEGWADAIGVLISSYIPKGTKNTPYYQKPTFPEYSGHQVVFDLSKIRPEGSYISGGFRAPGPEPLRKTIEAIETLFDSELEKQNKDVIDFRPILVYDTVMHCADAVLSGGVRRSATICIFDKTDVEMMKAKTWENFSLMKGSEKNKQRARSNNSALLLRNETSFEEFQEIMQNTKDFGEPGFIWSDSRRHVYNPCLSGDSVVETTMGNITMLELSNMNKADLVKIKVPTYNEETGKIEINSILNAFKTKENADLYEILFDDDTVIKCTPDHEIYTKNRGWVCAEDLLKDDIIVARSFSIHENVSTERIPFIHHNGDKPHKVDDTDNASYSSIAGWYFNKNTNRFCYLKSSHEYAFAKYLDENSIPWDVETEVLTKKIEDSIYTLRPDFTLYENGVKKYVKIKSTGSINDLDKNENHFSEVDIIYDVFQYTGYNYPQILSEWKNIYKNKTKRVKNIRQVNNEDVFDLTIENNHNFYANGTLVHNCVEIGMLPSFEVRDENDLAIVSQISDQIKIGDWVSGWQGCNLTEGSGRACNTPEDFYEIAEGLAVLGTVQATYTDFKYVSPVSKAIFEREALLGCSFTGWMNAHDVLFNEEVLAKGAQIVLETNEYMANVLGINPAARATCTKPAGNSSVILMTASGIHGEHSERYFRTVQINKEHEVAKLIKETFPKMVEDSVYSRDNKDYAISFPVVTKPGSKYKYELYDTELLKKVAFVQKHWVNNGKRIERCVEQNLNHNVSNTVDVTDWDAVTRYLYDFRQNFAGVSFLSAMGDLDWEQAPFTKVLDEKQIIEQFGPGSLFASGLIVDALKVFKSLWQATATFTGYGEKLYHTEEEALVEINKLSVSTLWKNMELPPELIQEKIELGIKPTVQEYLKYMNDQLISTIENGAMKRDIARRFKKFAHRYFNGDLLKTSYCLKHVHNFHRWNTINQYEYNIDWGQLSEPNYTDINTLGAAACYAGACEIS